MSPAGEGGGRGEAAATGGSAGGEGAAAAASDVELVAGRSPAVGPVGPAPDNGVSTTAGDRLVVPALEGGRDSDESEEAGRWDEVAPVRPLPKRGPGVYGVLVLLLLLLLLGRLAASVPYTMLSYSAPTAAKSMLQRGCCASVATDDEAPSWSCWGQNAACRQSGLAKKRVTAEHSCARGAAASSRERARSVGVGGSSATPAAIRSARAHASFGSMPRERRAVKALRTSCEK